MLELNLPRAHLKMRLMDEGTCRAGFATHSPKQNQLLASLPPEDYARLLPHLKPVSLPPGWIVHDAGARENTVLDRLGLEARVCECYGVVKREFDRIYHPKNPIGNAHLHRVFGHTHQDLSLNTGGI